jgi:hypothetical protein
MPTGRPPVPDQLIRYPKACFAYNSFMTTGQQQRLQLFVKIVYFKNRHPMQT